MKWVKNGSNKKKFVKAVRQSLAASCQAHRLGLQKKWGLRLQNVFLNAIQSVKAKKVHFCWIKKIAVLSVLLATRASKRRRASQTWFGWILEVSRILLVSLFVLFETWATQTRRESWYSSYLREIELWTRPRVSFSAITFAQVIRFSIFERLRDHCIMAELTTSPAVNFWYPPYPHIHVPMLKAKVKRFLSTS